MQRYKLFLIFDFVFVSFYWIERKKEGLNAPLMMQKVLFFIFRYLNIPIYSHIWIFVYGCNIHIFCYLLFGLL